LIARRERTNPHTSEYTRFHFAERREASFFDAALASAPRKLSTENTRGVSEGASPGQAGLDVLVLLLLLMSCQDLVWILVSVAGRVGISDSDVKDSRRAPPPEPVDRDIATEFWWLLCTVSVVPSVAVPASVD
jgi:hypothetical protein